MARLKHPDTGTEIEIADDDVQRLGDGYKAVSDDDDRDGSRRSRPTRKAPRS